jgi:hypothetical protein
VGDRREGVQVAEHLWAGGGGRAGAGSGRGCRTLARSHCVRGASHPRTAAAAGSAAFICPDGPRLPRTLARIASSRSRSSVPRLGPIAPRNAAKRVRRSPMEGGAAAPAPPEDRRASCGARRPCLLPPLVAHPPGAAILRMGGAAHSPQTLAPKKADWCKEEGKPPRRAGGAAPVPPPAADGAARNPFPPSPHSRYRRDPCGGTRSRPRQPPVKDKGCRPRGRPGRVVPASRCCEVHYLYLRKTCVCSMPSGPGHAPPRRTRTWCPWTRTPS